MFNSEKVRLFIIETLTYQPYRENTKFAGFCNCLYTFEFCAYRLCTQA